ncbi:MAG: hypothetical protein Kow00107_00530 [Planctomycetota bacterium]
MDEVLRSALQQYPRIEKHQKYLKPFGKQDVLGLLTLLAYRGIFEKGIHKMAIDGLAELGEEGIEELKKVLEGSYSFPDKDSAKYINRQQYEEYAILALGMLGGRESAEILGKVAQTSGDISDVFEVSKPVKDFLLSAGRDKLRNKRFRACLSLGMMQDRENIPILKQVLQEEKDKYVRSAASVALYLCGGQMAVDALRMGIDQPRSFPHAKSFALVSLGALGASDPLQEMKAALCSEHPEVRIASSFALAHLINKRVSTGRDCSDLRNIYLTAMWREEDLLTRRRMSVSLLALDSPQAVAMFDKFLYEWRDPFVSAVASIAFALSSPLKTAEVVPILPVDQEPVVEKARMYAIAMAMQDDRRKLALDMASEEDSLLRALGIFAVARTCGKDAIRELEKHRFSRSDSMITAVYAWCSVIYEGEKGYEAAKYLVKCDDALARAVGLVALGAKSGKQALETLALYKPDKKGGDVQCRNLSLALMEAWPLVSAVREGLDDSNGRVRAATCVSLGLLDQTGVEEILHEVAKKDIDGKARAYSNLALSLMSFEPDEAGAVIETIKKLFAEEKDYLSRCWMCLALSRFHDSREALNLLLDALEDPHSDVKAMAAISIGLLGETSVSTELRNHIGKHKNSPIGYAGYIGLGLLGQPENVSYFLRDFELATNPQEYCAMSFGLAKSMKERQAELLFRLVMSDDIFTREYAVKTLGMIEDLSEDERIKIITLLSDYEEEKRKESRSFKEDSLIRFHTAVVRYALGDSSAIKVAVETMREKDFYLEKTNDMDWITLFDPINASLPVYYRVKPFYWSDTD